jgi:hypothetical protein
MKSRAGRLTLFILFVAALGVTAYLFWSTESSRRAQAAATDRFRDGVRAAARDVLDVRAAQQAYVAAGQGDAFWAGKVSQALASANERVAVLRAAASSTDAQSEIETAAGALQDFAQMDARARDYTKADQKLLASDLIFTNGLELTGSALASLDKAATAEQHTRGAAVDLMQQRQLFALAAAAAAASLVVMLLLPMGDAEPNVPILAEAGPAPARATSLQLNDPADILSPEIESWSAPRRISETPEEVPPPAPAPEPVVAAPPTAAAAPAVPEAGPAFDFGAMASLCTDLSRVQDTMALPPLLDRAGRMLDAVGIILWIADPDGRELNPVLAQGYPRNLVTRLGTIPRDAENATAAAFRTALLQTVDADAVSNGAIAAPLVTCGGCVGVMAAEVRGQGWKQDAKLAAATILAAQLASLVGPPAARSDAKVEAGGG